jgi:hypothetical protein
MTIDTMIALYFSIVAVLFSGMTAIFAILSYCKVVGMEKSTHQIQYMTPDEMKTLNGNPTGQDLVDKMAGMYQEDFQE